MGKARTSVMRSGPFCCVASEGGLRVITAQCGRATIGFMTCYGANEIANSFRVVRNNTLKIAEEIPEDKYSFWPAEGTRTVAQTLIHISNAHRFALAIHRDEPRTSMVGFDFMAFIKPIAASEQEPMTKAQIIARLTAAGEEYEAWLRTLPDDFLGQSVMMPPGGTPPSKTRFELLIAVKEHEMHHRGQLMLIERLIGITPHLTREQEARRAAMMAAAAAAAKN
jgi:uncharacterized damage-inducible protein DinB